jgi:hypothetical protein
MLHNNCVNSHFHDISGMSKYEVGELTYGRTDHHDTTYSPAATGGTQTESWVIMYMRFCNFIFTCSKIGLRSWPVRSLSNAISF